MAAKNWINSYLGTLDVAPGIDDSKSSLLLRERGKFSPTRYFVDQVIGFDEVDLYSYWVEAAYTRSPPERNTRLENMCWRIWNLARQKKQLEGVEAQRQVEHERGCGEATADTFEDLTEGKKGDTGGDLSAVDKSHNGRLPRITDVEKMEACADQQKGKKLYIVLISLHGLVRGENMELGRDSDTGGQVKYVVELARALGSMQGVHRVDLLTRQVFAPDVDGNYSEATEMLPPRNSDGLMNDMGDSNGAYIIRVPFGPRNKYLPKESLWPYIPEFVDGALKHILRTSKILGEHIGGGHPVWPVAIHGHYADAGDAAARLSGALNVPMVFTGHSLGRWELSQLLTQGRLSKDEINATYKVMRRIEAEELALDASEIVIISTGHEIELWRLYDGFDPVLERMLRARIRRNVSCYGRFMPRMMLNPPRMEFYDIVPYDGDMYGETRGNDDQPTSEDPPIWTEIMRFFSNPYKPMIIALARPDPKTNLTTLVKQFGECRPLRELANLTLIMGNRDDVDEMPSDNASVFLSILKLIDKYDLYGQVAYPKHHKKSDVPDIYRLAVMTKGVFISLALSESFGLTLIEAAAYGLPIVATKISVHEDMLKVLDNGILVGSPDKESISLGVESSILGKESLGEESIGLVEESFGLGEESIGMDGSLCEMSIALIKLVSDKQLWAKCRLNGLKNVRHYSWPEHCKTYLSRIVGFKQRHPWCPRSDEWDENAVPDSRSDSLRDIHDISLNLKFSMDGEKNSGSDNAYSSLVSDDRKSKLENDVSTQSKRDHNSSTGKFPALRRRKHLIVIAVDFGDISDLYSSARKIFDAVEKERTEGSIGFILSTSFTLAEINSFLISARLHPTEFDAFICNSGSDIYYSSPNPENNPFIVDWYYHSRIKYRWGGEGLRKTLIRWADSINDKKGENEEQVVTEDEKISTNYCYSFKVRNPGKVPPVKEVQKSMRIRALRCHVIYCQNGKKINVIPLLASRSLALRFLYIQWAVDLSKMVVFVGESGDTDYEGLLGGIHKSVVLKGVSAGATNQLHANRNYLLSDVMPIDSPNIVQATEDCSSDGIRTLLEKLGFLKG